MSAKLAGLAAAFCLWASPPQAQDRVVIQEADDRSQYAIKVLRLILEKSAEQFGAFSIETDPLIMRQGRRVRQLARGAADFNLLWTGTSQERETILAPIRFPIFRGLLGWRVFIIREDAQASFDALKNADGLRDLTACQGMDWPDTLILERADFTVRGVSAFEPLFQLVDRMECDFFPRALVEPYAELAMRPAFPRLVVERRWMLRYPYALYFFVRRNDDRLRRRLAFGFERAYADGDMLRLFYGHRPIREALARAAIDDRRIVDLANPLATPETPFDRAELWFSRQEWSDWRAKSRE